MKSKKPKQKFKPLNRYDRNVALSKMAFAKNVFDRKAPFDEMDFSHFSSIFIKLRTIFY